MFILQKKLITATLLGASLLTACGMNTNKNVAETPGVYKQTGNTINKQNEEDLYNPEKVDTHAERSREFGYVRQVKSPVPNKDINYKGHTINREQVANSISKIAVTIPRVHDAAVLVTDEEALVAYKTDAKDKKGRFEVADQVKKTAISVLPRWFHVYVTDDPALRQDVENIAYMDASSANREDVIKGTVKRMLQRSPQGRKLSDGANANGEMMNETNKQVKDQNEYRMQYDKGTLK
ncbi:YhcN/YlaJ family sporulation lipoprotein [Heyndrickxia sp. NPDC080065]|uniref:YhcN/YlaJ family sporulation lipoprotein n=1 Tax=Heyndrickxia sp. NPDC080065 TaxID=3390568 RepID=UPI003D05A477